MSAPSRGGRSACLPVGVRQPAESRLFADTPAGAHASALICSLVETAKANGLGPYLWLRHVLRHLPNATTDEHFEALLPWNCPPADSIPT